MIWPAQVLSFRADAQVHGTSLDLTLQPLDGVSQAARRRAMDRDRRRASPPTAGSRPTSAPSPCRSEAYPLLDDPFLTVNEFVLTGATTSSDGFCGSVSGYAQVFGREPSDRIRLEGSTFGAVRITGDTLPSPVSACPGR